MNLVTDKSIASLRGKLWIQGEHFYGEIDLVRDALSGWLGLGPKLKVFYAVVVTLAVLVMRKLGFKKLAAEVLFHHKPMFKNFPARLSMGSGETKHDVTLLGQTSTHRPFLRWAKAFVLGNLESLSALAAANLFESSRWAFLWFPHLFNRRSAYHARHVRPFSTAFAPTNSAARNGAVHGVFAKSFAVACEFARGAAERFSAVLTGKRGALRCVLSPSNRVVAFIAAVFCLTAILCGELFAALGARLNHLVVLDCVSQADHSGQNTEWEDISMKGIA